MTVLVWTIIWKEWIMTNWSGAAADLAQLSPKQSIPVLTRLRCLHSILESTFILRFLIEQGARGSSLS